MEEKKVENETSETPKLDNPWLQWFAPVFLICIGTTAGWVFGPIFFTRSTTDNEGLDLYARASFAANEYGALTGFAGGLILGLIIASQLRSFPKKDTVELPLIKDEHAHH